MNRIKGLILLSALLVTSALPIQTFAQSAKVIKYGDVTSDAFTADKTSASYTFKAAANDVVVLYLKQDGSDSTVAPVLTVTDSAKKAVGDTTAQFTTYSVTFAFQATAGGTYTVAASTSDATKLGKYKLYLFNAPLLTAGKAATGHASSDQNAYYAYITGDPFTLTYSKQAGDFTPVVNINQIADDSSLTQLAYIGGSIATAGSVTVKPKTNRIYILSVESALFDININTVTADFTLQVDTAK